MYIYLVSSDLYSVPSYLYLVTSYIYSGLSYLYSVTSYLYLASSYLYSVTCYLYSASSYLYLVTSYKYSVCFSQKQQPEKERPTHVFSCTCCEIFKNTYFEEHLRTAASVLSLAYR